MATSTKEIAFEASIGNYLTQITKQYIKRAPGDYNKELCLDKEMIFSFIKNTQPKAFEKLQETHGDLFEQKFLKRLTEEIKVRGLLDVLRNGIKDYGVEVQLAYFKPASGLNPETQALYQGNILSLIRQLKYSLKNENSIDTVLFLNGLPICTIELKNPLSGQNVQHAINQYKYDRDANEPLLQFKRCLVHRAVDPDLVYMTTKLNGGSTYFLPFNKGNNLWAGNPVNAKGYKTSYLWETIFDKEVMMELIANYVCLTKEEVEDSSGKKSIKETLIFPRFHQWDVVEKLLSDAKNTQTGKNYLIQHSAGSGKSNSIAWLAHHLAELHNEKNQNIFDSVLVITDRRVLDKQLQNTITQFQQIDGVVKSIVDGSKSLKQALEEGGKIIITTLQKFPFILDDLKTIAGKTFAVIVDEAHSSQSGEGVKSLKQALTVSSLEEAEKEDTESEEEDLEEMVLQELRSRGKLKNVSFFAFTATPKNKTLEMFGEKQLDDTYKPFHLYSMRQAIEEGFILDTLKNYTTYKTYFALLKKIENDPEYKKSKAVQLTKRYVDLHNYTIEKKVDIIVTHFVENIKHELNGLAKAMIVTKSRLHAVRFKLAFDKYLQEHNYSFKTLVAFSGTVKDTEYHEEYTESSMNGFPETKTAHEFKKSEYKFIIVANKFQTGFDQPLLTAMYVDKQLSWIAAVQTLSRLNRTYPGKDNALVLDFVNDTEVIQKSFQPYYETTVLSGSTDPNNLYDIQRKVNEYNLFTESDVDAFVADYLKNATPDIINSHLDRIIENYVALNDEEKRLYKDLCGDYCKLYAFLAQLLPFEDSSLEKYYLFLKLLKKKFPVNKESLPTEILEQINMDKIQIGKKSEGSIVLEKKGFEELDPLNTQWGGTQKPEEKDLLSHILDDVNKRFWTTFSEDDKVILNNLFKTLSTRNDMKGYINNEQNSKDHVKSKFDELFTEELVKMVTTHQNLYQKIDKETDMKEYIKSKMFDFMCKEMEK